MYSQWFVQFSMVTTGGDGHGVKQKPTTKFLLSSLITLNMLESEEVLGLSLPSNTSKLSGIKRGVVAKKFYCILTYKYQPIIHYKYSAFTQIQFKFCVKILIQSYILLQMMHLMNIRHSLYLTVKFLHQNLSESLFFISYTMLLFHYLT